MAFERHFGSFNITTAAAGNTVAVSGLGFQPKAIKFWWSGRTESTDTAGSATSLRGMGFAVSASSFCAVATRDQDGAPTSITNGAHRDDACILELANNNMVGWADIQSIDSDGFTLEILDAFPTDLRVHYVAYGGTDITNAEIGMFTGAGTAPVNQSVTNSGGFPPDITFFLLTRGTTAPDVGVPAFFSYGAATDSTHEYVLADRAIDASGVGGTRSYCRGGECMALIIPAFQNRAEFVSHNADGFTINWLERGGDSNIYWLSIKGGEWLLGDLLTQTDTTTAITETSFGFTPKVVEFASASRAEDVQATYSLDAAWSIGAAISTSVRGAQQTGSLDGNTIMFVQTAIEFDAVYINVDPDTDALVGLMDVQSFDSDGFTAIMDDADPAQSFVWYVAAGDAAAAGSTVTPGAGAMALTGASFGMNFGLNIPTDTV